MTTEMFCFYLQKRLIQTSQTGGQRYSDTYPFSIPCSGHTNVHLTQCWTNSILGVNPRTGSSGYNGLAHLYKFSRDVGRVGVANDPEGVALVGIVYL